MPNMIQSSNTALSILEGRKHEPVIKALLPCRRPGIYALTQAIPKEENGFQNSAHGLNPEDIPTWLDQQQNIPLGIGLPEGRVPQSVYWLYDGEQPVGMCKLRTTLTAALLKSGGNIGYAIAPFARGKGYGKEQLRLILQEAKKHGLTRVLLTVYNDNKASIAVALANGGTVEKVSEEQHYIWINLWRRKTVIFDLDDGFSNRDIFILPA